MGPVFQFRNNGRPVGNGWTSPPNGARWGVDYLSRRLRAVEHVRQRAGGDPLRLHGDLPQGADAARERLLVTHALQRRGASLLDESAPVFARHQEESLQ